MLSCWQMNELHVYSWLSLYWFLYVKISLQSGNIKIHFWKYFCQKYRELIPWPSTGRRVHFLSNTSRQVSKYDKTKETISGSRQIWQSYTGSRFTCTSTSNTSIWQDFDVIEHRLPVGIRSWNFASIILLTGLTNWEGALVSSLNFTFWTTLLHQYELSQWSIQSAGRGCLSPSNMPSYVIITSIPLVPGNQFVWSWFSVSSPGLHLIKGAI